MNSRAVAAGVVSKWLSDGGFVERLLDPVAADRAFVTEMVYGVVKGRRTLEWIAARCSRRQPDPATLPFLMIGLCQTWFMSNVEEYAAVNETVTAAKAVLGDARGGFVNAVLRRALREKALIERELVAASLGVRESHPDLLVDRWVSTKGLRQATRLCRWNNERPRTVIRINLLRTDMGSFRSELEQHDMAVVPHPFAPERCIVLPPGVRVEDVPGYAEGLFCVQDPSTLAPVQMLDPQPGETVLDACAAPGGKAIFIGELMQGKGALVAMDLVDGRLDLLRKNRDRARMDFMEIRRGNAGAASRLLGGRTFDAILADVPCTNTGTLRRRAEARWRFSAKRLSDLMDTQRSILDGLAALLRPGGRIVYSTCSLEREENEKQVTSWIRKRPDFSIVRESLLFPPDTDTDGGYSALLRRG
ncbi:MAG: 16S rRNA (cytosine(967)-C(5))-methyltransferase RsmB [Lentisphaerales bacterium]|nr:MAG: 16S rRNA (cytosine(967)-C(5))-methyltransferase RsmB [Lentisphaerales bacterium]